MYRNVYFLHTPKTAGRFFYKNICVPLKNIVESNGISMSMPHNEGRLAHQGWSSAYITDDTYVIKLFREPVEHTVSFYCHLKGLTENGTRRIAPGSVHISRAPFMAWFDKHKDILKDFQTKYLVLGDPGSGDILAWPEFATTSPDPDLVISRLTSKGLALRNTSLTSENVLAIKNKIAFDVGLPPILEATTPTYDPEFYNEDSSNLYKELTDADKEYILSYFPLDSLVYNTDKYFWTPDD